MVVDHSLTYKTLSIRNLPHIWRYAAIVRTIGRLGLDPGRTVYHDVGCSDGYLTSRIAERFGFKSVVGWDHSHSHLKAAKERYPRWEWRHIDLNDPEAATSIAQKADFLTCFETLEHVGDVDVALAVLQRLVRPGGLIFITVPIESGVRGALKFIIKTRLFGYKLDELSDEPETKKAYRRALLRGEEISRFRDARGGWGTHFGFDYRPFEARVTERFGGIAAWSVGTTRFLVVKAV